MEADTKSARWRSLLSARWRSSKRSSVVAGPEEAGSGGLHVKCAMQAPSRRPREAHCRMSLSSGDDVLGFTYFATASTLPNRPTDPCNSHFVVFCSFCIATPQVRAFNS